MWNYLRLLSLTTIQNQKYFVTFYNYYLKLCLLKLPTFLTLQPKPYEPETLQLGDVTEFEEEDQTVASARVSCTARWKISPDAKDIFNLSYKVFYLFF